jgi:hypothetical protein
MLSDADKGFLLVYIVSPAPRDYQRRTMPRERNGKTASANIASGADAVP